MSCLVFSVLVGSGCLIAGWVALPEPAWFRDFWARRGWARRT
jgi:hypothetical protein